MVLTVHRHFYFFRLFQHSQRINSIVDIGQEHALEGSTLSDRWLHMRKTGMCSYSTIKKNRESLV